MSKQSTTVKLSSDFETVLADSSSQVASFDTNEKSLMMKFQHFLHSSPAMVPLIVLIMSIIFFGALVGGKFFSAFALTLILQQVAITGIVGLAQTLVVLTAGIDLSVGAIMVLSSVIMGQFTMRYGIPAPVSILCGIGFGGLMGALNGFLVAKIKLPPFIVTLGTWQIYSATVYIYGNNETIRSQDIEAASPLFQLLGHSFRIGSAVFTYGVVLLLIMAAVLWYILSKTAWGRHVYAVGDDPEAAKLAGVSVTKMLISVYLFAGVICGIAGWALIGRVGSISPQSGQFANIESITAVVIGGTSLFGGRGSILGTIFGAMTVGVFALGLRLWGTDPQWTFLTVGVLIISAVAVDQWIRKVAG
ncbi:fructose transport system permease protein [Pararhizobium capsulatum DSM 1112]|uniref:Fructose transport system permease protein n=1 Tax=Pararhizobium capsulatum DSM 1112 TaxID=1121113 RepID=A0ABU0BKN4_9HYPH|nr:ABC transporter permease [Pararhizobium capsulatum]MDQ0318807.1 fructose transport system permease protein [Pararhizobium capsulatum DSM 1112]